MPTDQIFPDEPPAVDAQMPDDPEAYIQILPENERPYTVVLYSIDAARQSASAKAGTAIVHIHATDPRSAEGAALKQLNSVASGKLWHFAEPLFVTEGFHLDVRPEGYTL